MKTALSVSAVVTPYGAWDDPRPPRSGFRATGGFPIEYYLSRGPIALVSLTIQGKLRTLSPSCLALALKLLDSSFIKLLLVMRTPKIV